MNEKTIIKPAMPARAVERRQVSVLFTDMVGYTAIVDDLGEEKALALTQIIYKRLTNTVQEHGGSVRGFAGDSIMALFGIPEAQEDAALRACRAALAIQAEFAKSADEFEAQFNVRPSMRVGVSSGVAMMAAVEGDNAPLTAVGSTVNLASRIEGLAPEGGCLICDATRRLVEWVVDIELDGEHQIKGLAKSQKLWKLQSIRADTKRFDASLARGLSKFVGRDPEMSTLCKALDEAKHSFRWVDLVAEPGLGKTRLVFEFLKQAESQVTLVLRGHGSADGQQIPFLPFIEVVRRSFEIRNADDRALILQKFESGLEPVGLNTPENLGLLLNLLGREPPQGALDGLDGVLIGLRTRALLLTLLAAQYSKNRIILLIEDIHWIDGSSEELLSSLLTNDEMKNLLVITSRRPHYDPDWLKTPRISTLALKPLTAMDIAHLAESWLGVDAIPEALMLSLAERAQGNPLFGEEILSFLLEEGALHIEAGGVKFDIDSAGSVLPASMQSLLTSRIDRLNQQDRALLQVAATIGRRFDLGLLAVVTGNQDDAGAALGRLEAQDMIYRESHASDYIFKHTMLRETVYQSMVSDHRAGLHLAIAEALERRYEGRLTETADVLAFHYALTDRNEQAFTYSAMAGAKSMGIFSLGEANRYFASAFDLYNRDPKCASNDGFAAFLADYALCSNISLHVKKLIKLADKVKPILAEIGDARHHALFLHHYVACLVCNCRFLDALRVRKDLSSMAARLGDPVSMAYALVSELSVSNYCAPIPNETYESKKREVEALLAKFDDAYLQNFYLASMGWNEIIRGRVAEAHQTADRLLETGVSRNDPRSLGYGTAMKALIAMLGDDHEKALQFSEQALSVSRVEFDTAIATTSKNSVIIPLNKPGAIEDVQRYLDFCVDKGWILFLCGPDVMFGTGLAMNGRIGDGLRHIELAIKRRETEGYQIASDWYRLYLCEIYLAILSGEGGASFGVLLRNSRSLTQVILFGAKRIVSLVEQVRVNPQFDANGHYIARCELILGMLYKIKKKTTIARAHLTEAQRIVKPLGSSPMLTRIETALAELEAT